MTTWKEFLKKQTFFKTTAFYLVSSIQYEVLDIMHVTKMGTGEKKPKGKRTNFLHIHTKLSRKLSFMKNNR